MIVKLSSSMDGQTKEQLHIVKRLRSGDIIAFDVIYRSYSPKLYSFAFSLLKDHDQSEELVQDVFVTLWEKREQINTDLSFENYLFTICYNSIRKFFRKKKLEKKVIDYLIRNTPESISATSQTVIYNELIELVDRTIDRLPAKRRTVFKLSRQEGMKIKEIAEKLNISSRTVETHLTKALRFIKDELEKVSILSALYFYLFLY